MNITNITSKRIVNYYVIVNMRALIFLLYYVQVEGSCHPYPKLTLPAPSGKDPGKPLFLTPYVKSGNISEGRRQARVGFTEILGVISYSGYFTVNETYDSNQFFWYFPAMLPKSQDAPVIVWLQGGPGATSLYGIFMENGPFIINKGRLRRRKYTWALNHHVIYIDNPVGTGFSFTKDDRGYCTDETKVGEELYSTVLQFFHLFPDLQQNTFFVTGESYAGKYIPALAYTIHKNNPTAKLKINMKGMAIGNGLSDPENQLGYGKYLYQIGLIDSNQAKVFQDYEIKAKSYIQNKQWDQAFETFDLMINGDLTGGKSLFVNFTGFSVYYNYLYTKDYTKNEDFGPMLQLCAIRKEIHVGDLPFNDGAIVEKHLKQDFTKSVAPWIAELLDYYYVVIYNGQLDVIVAYPLTVNYLQNLNFTDAAEYKTAKRNIWYVDGEIAGYMKQAGRLVEVLVRNAGHMVPRDQPKWALSLITCWTHL